MSTTLGSDKLNLREQLVRIDRALAETHKLQAESDKLQAKGQNLLAEQLKYGSEQLKLTAEEAKLTRDRWLAPWFLTASLVGGIVVAAINHFGGE